MNVGARIKTVREERGLRQQDLAKRLGVAANTITRYETGGREPNFEMVEKIAHALQIEPSELFREPDVAKLEPRIQAVQSEDESLFYRPEAQEWLRAEGHLTAEEFLQLAQGKKSAQEIEQAIEELYEQRDHLLDALRREDVRSRLFPRRQGLLTKEERIKEAMRPAKLAWELGWEIRHEYSARESALINYSRTLFIEGVDDEYLSRLPMSPEHHEELERRRRVLEAKYARALAVV
jgi:transcriptional regulator with XRE-family HTH domain